MDLYEYQGKELFKRFGIPVSEGRLATTPDEARAAAEEIGGQVVVKAQVLTGGRGKAGGIKLAENPDDAREKAEQILGLDIRGHVVRKLWIESASDIAKEYYLSLTFDRGAKQPLFMFTKEGGIDIEEVAESTPEKLVRLHVDPFEGFQPWQGRRLVYGAGVEDPSEQKQILSIVGKLYEAFVATDAMLTEINPLIVTPDGEVKALDSKFTVDDAALFRHPDIAEMRDLDAVPPEERAAREKGVTYVKLDGEVGILGNGAGLVMSTLDVIALAGGRPANFCDLGGGGDAEGVVDALGVITADPAGEVDLLQRLRRDHALRRGGARDPRRARPDDDRASDRRATRRDERGGRQRDPQGGLAPEPPRRADDARRSETRSGARRMTDVWSERAEAFRESAAHRRAPISTCWSSGASPATAFRRSTSRPAAATWRAGCGGRAATSSRSTQRPG